MISLWLGFSVCELNCQTVNTKSKNNEVCQYTMPSCLTIIFYFLNSMRWVRTWFCKWRRRLITGRSWSPPVRQSRTKLETILPIQFVILTFKKLDHSGQVEYWIQEWNSLALWNNRSWWYCATSPDPSTGGTREEDRWWDAVDPLPADKNMLVTIRINLIKNDFNSKIALVLKDWFVMAS
jgi:hypothetical protein